MIAIFCVIKCMRAQQSTFQSIFDIFILIDGIQTDRDAGQIVKLFAEFWKCLLLLLLISNDCPWELTRNKFYVNQFLVVLVQNVLNRHLVYPKNEIQ